MGRKWTNSKGIGLDQERSNERSLDKLRKELIKTEKKPYQKRNDNNKPYKKKNYKNK